MGRGRGLVTHYTASQWQSWKMNPGVQTPLRCSDPPGEAASARTVPGICSQRPQAACVTQAEVRLGQAENGRALAPRTDRASPKGALVSDSPVRHPGLMTHSTLGGCSAPGFPKYPP